MNQVTVKTNIHCKNCVEKLEPHFNSADPIRNWKVDLDTDSPLKELTVQGEDISVSYIDDILHKEGYAIVNDDEETKEGFWVSADKWRRASFNTLNCLIGCSIGDFGMIIYLQAYHPGTSMATQMILAIIAGLMTSITLETVILKIREGFNWMLALKTAFGMSFISMVGMEIAMNTTDFMVTGGKAAFEDPMYWGALGLALIAGFIAPLPYNYYKLQKFNQACH